MRTGFSFIASPAGRAETASKLRPLSAAAFCTIAGVDAFAGMNIVPAGYCLPFALNGCFTQYTSSFAFSSRLTAMNASLT